MRRRFAAALSISVFALAAGALPGVSFAQLHPNPVMNQALKSQLGWTSMVDALADAARSAGQLRAMMADLNERIASARTRYWAAYPNGPDFAAAKKEFESVLRTKDFYYLQQAIVGTGGIMQILGGNIDDGIPNSTSEAFNAWVEQCRTNIEATGTGFSDVQKAREAIIAADPTYFAYVQHRNLEEFRRAGKQPPGVSAEQWRIATIGAQFSGPGAPDPYGLAEEIVRTHRTFVEQCPSQASAYLHTTVTPAACKCINAQFRKLEPFQQWGLETDLTRDKFLIASVSKTGVPAEVSKCLAK
jgi:hypothetical protein